MAVLAEYFCGRDGGYLFLAGVGSREPEVTTFPLHPLYDEVADYFGRVLGEGGGEPGESLRALVQPIVDGTREDEPVWIVPHGILHYLPFHALPTPEGTLGFRNPICYGPSASALAVCRNGPRLDGGTVVAAGDPTGDLAYARREAERVAEAFGGDVLLGAQATKRELLAALDRHEAVDVVHLACHGRAGAEDPFESGVVLAAEPGAERAGADFLSAGELLRRRLSAALVTVSACDAGLGNVESSDEVLGLTRALLYAGVSSVLLSYWPVDDLSTYLMVTRFYEELRSPGNGGSTKADALRAAQRHVHDLTLGQVVAACEKGAAECAARDDVGGQLDFLEEAADWAAAAGDLDEAVRRLRELLALLDDAPGWHDERQLRLRDRLEELEFRALLESPVPDYEAHPFAAEAAWAGFFLHGDWKL